jgi:hypothetical protein
MSDIFTFDEAQKRWNAAYAITPDAPLYHTEFGYYGIERWQEQGLDPDADFATEFGYHPSVAYSVGHLGWCEAAFMPVFEDKILEDRGDYEVYQDWAGRGVLVFKGRRSGFMPEYVDHPVKDMKTWEEKCKWRMDPTTPERLAAIDESAQGAKEFAEEKNGFVRQMCVGGYMYLRSLIGPTELMYAWYDMPDVVHDCMQTWLALADATTARVQEHVTFDELFLAEDICYNHGLLCSPDVMNEFLLPYYQQLIANMKSRQIDRSRHLHVQVDTDGWAVPTIEIYRDAIGLDMMSPFEVASGCDVVEIGKQFPWLIMTGGIDKREMAKGPAAIDAMLDRIIPAMRKRGGYIPTCDHGVPEEVSLDSYRHYRKRMLELGG